MLLGLDVGIDAARAVALDESGAVRASFEEAYPVDQPRPGWMEQDPADWWRASRNVLGRVIAEAGGEAMALGVTGQMRGSVFLDDRGVVVRPAILGGDQRAAGRATEIAERLRDHRLFEITGSRALTGSQLAAIAWLRDVEPVQYRHTALILPPKDYVRLMLTGDASTDPSDASGTSLFDTGRRVWSDEILGSVGIPTEWLPRVLDSPVIAGRLRAPLVAEIGLPSALPIAAGAGDLAALAVATGVTGEARIASSIGSRGQMMATMEDFSIGSSLGTLCHALPGRYLAIAATLTAGSSLRWWRDILGGQLSFDELTRMAESVPPGADGLFFAPSGEAGRAATDEPTVRGAFVGLRAHHTSAHLTRALMEGVVFSLRNGLDRLRTLGVEVKEIRATGGGTRSRLWNQMQADVLRAPVLIVAAERGPAYGAALIAGVASRGYASVVEAAASVDQRRSTVEPDQAGMQRYEAIYHTYAELAAVLQQELPAPDQKLLQSSTRGVAQPG